MAGFLGFALMGAAQSLYGPLYLAWDARFRLGPGVSLVTSLHFLGAVTSILGGGLVMRLFSARVLLVASSGLLACGCLLVGLAPVWAAVLAGAFVLGLGYGGLTVGMNSLFASGFGARSTMMVNVLNACWGLGSILGPLLVSRDPNDARFPFLLCASVGGLLVVLASLAASEHRVAPVATPGARPFPPALLALFALLCFLYTGLEVGTGSFETTHLRRGLGLDERLAASLNALFWMGLTVGRLLVVPISLRLGPASIVLGSSAGAVLGLGLAHVPAAAGIGYALCGVCCGPIFPTTFVWATRTLGNSPTANSLVIGAGSLGAVLLPPLVGWVTSPQPLLIPSVLLAFGLAHASLTAMLKWRTGDA